MKRLFLITSLLVMAAAACSGPSPSQPAASATVSPTTTATLTATNPPPTQTATALPTSTWTPTATASFTPEPTESPTPSPSPTATLPMTPVASGQVIITTILFDGSKGNSEPDEYVEIRNDDPQPIQLLGWTLRDKADHIYTFPDFILQPGQVCRVYTNEEHPDSCGFSYNFSETAIWNNGGDCAYLKNRQGELVHEYCY